MQAGVAGVVASLWAVNDLSTMLLMARFYDLWRTDGLAPSAALRQAQRWLRDSTLRDFETYLKQPLPEFVAQRLPADIARRVYTRLPWAAPEECIFCHPYHWAAFGYTGL